MVPKGGMRYVNNVESIARILVEFNYFGSDVGAFRAYQLDRHRRNFACVRDRELRLLNYPWLGLEDG